MDNVENAYQIFKRVLQEALNTFVSKFIIQKTNDPPWYNKRLKNLKNVRNKEYKRAKTTGNFDMYNSVTDIFSQMQSI